MSLPKLVTPEFFTTLPSNKQEIKFRPFLVKEEKILYMALEGGDQREINGAVLRILESCVLTPGVDVNKLASFDVEFLFLQLRAKSVSEKIEVNVRHQHTTECTHVTPLSIAVEDIKISAADDHSMVVKVDGGITFKMRYPTVSGITKLASVKNDVDKTFEMIAQCVVSVHDAETSYTEFTRDELKDFLETMSKTQFEQLMKFFETMPKLRHSVTYTCENCGATETIDLEGLQSFFT